MITHTNQEKFFFYLLLLIALVLGFLVFRPFIIVLLLAGSFSVVIHPLYLWFLKRVTKSSSFSAFLTVLVFVVVVGAPLVGISFMVYGQASNLFGSGSIITPLVNTLTGLSATVLPSGFESNIEDMVMDFVSSASKNIAGLFASTLSTLFSILLMIMSMFFFLKDGKIWKSFIVRLSPLADAYDSTILSELKSTINGVVKGYLLIALIQGILVGIGLWVFGVPNSAFWGVISGIAAFIPVIGTGIVAIPMIVYLYVQGQTTSAVGLLIWSGVIVGLIDNVLNPIIVGRQVNLHPLVILFAVLGGIAFFGPAGILVGPLVVSLIHTLGKMYLRKFEKLPQDTK